MHRISDILLLRNSATLRFQKQYHSRDPVSLIIFRSVNTWHMTSTDTGNTSLRPGMSTGSGIELTCKLTIFAVSYIIELPKTRSFKFFLTFSFSAEI
jgi:hypothetical protein